MINEIKDIYIKILTCYFFKDIVDTKNFHPNNIKIDDKSYKNILIYYIGCVTIKDSKYANLYTLSSTKWLVTLNKLMEINI